MIVDDFESSRHVSFLDTLRPWNSMIEVAPSHEIRERITAFCSHSGILYALMASMSTAGLVWDPPGSYCVNQETGISITTLSSLYMDINMRSMMKELMAPLFCVSSFCNIQGLMTSMLCLGRVQVVSDLHVKDFVRGNWFTLHTCGWLLIPAVSTFAGGVVCVAGLSHGEPTTTIAVVSVLGVGGLTTYQMVQLGFATEKLALDVKYGANVAKNISEKKQP
jgi:hypothetical protein